jgi:SAM-dependent methyltransferase
MAKAGESVMTGRREELDRRHFDSIAARYAAKDRAPSSQIARRHRLERTIATVPLEGFERVLEIGCGAGFAARYLQGRFERYIGIDHSRQLIEVAVGENSGPGTHFEVSSVSDFDPPWPFDLIFMIGVLHHLENAGDAMKTMARWLRPGGYLVANEPQPANPFLRVARRARARLDSSYSDEQDEISASELRAIFVQADLEVVEITPQGVFSTPFSEVILRPSAITAPLARAACAVDTLLERQHRLWLQSICWNLIGCGRAPAVQR